MAQAADSLVNPVYYFDLDAVGRTARALLQQPDVSYVIVYDGDGNVLRSGGYMSKASMLEFLNKPLKAA